MGSWKSRVLNIIILIFNFFFWVMTLDAFGGVMHELTIPNVGTGSYYYDHLEGSAAGAKYNTAYSSCKSAQCKACDGGGDGLVAMMVFAWFALDASLFLSFTRIFGFSAKIPRLNLTPEKSAFIETILTTVELFLFFFGLIAWGTCYSQTSSYADSVDGEISGVGFGFMIFCFFMLCLQTPAMWLLVRRNSEFQTAFCDAGTAGAAGASGDAVAQPNNQFPEVSSKESIDAAKQQQAQQQQYPQFPPPQQYPPQQQPPQQQPEEQPQYDPQQQQQPQYDQQQYDQQQQQQQQQYDQQYAQPVEGQPTI